MFKRKKRLNELKDLKKEINSFEDYDKNVEEESYKSMGRDEALEAVRKNGITIQYLPKYQNDIEFIKSAIENNPEAIIYVGDAITNEMIIEVLTNINKSIEKENTENAKTINNPMTIYNNHYKGILYLINITRNLKEKFPKRFEDPKFIIALLNINPSLARFAPENVQRDREFLKIWKKYDEPTFSEIIDKYTSKKR